MTQERRRYGFVLERQCSLAKHYLSYHNQGSVAYQQNIEKWSEVAKTREYLPETVENIFSNRIRVGFCVLSFDILNSFHYSKYPYGKTKIYIRIRAVHISTTTE